MILQSLKTTLEEIVTSGLEEVPIPYKKGNSIRIKNIVIRRSKNFGHLVIDTKVGKQVAETFSKAGAIALALDNINGRRNVETILRLDRKIEKNYNDALFFKHTIESTKDEFRKEMALTRFDVAYDKTQDAKHELESFIFDK